MKKTVGSVDRIVRGVLGIAVLVIAGVAGFSSIWGIVLVVVATILVLTGSSAMCPLYSALGVNTLGHDNKGSAGGSKIHVH